MKCEKPSRYTGGEFGAPAPVWGDFNFCACFPDLYEVGMSNLGIKIVAKSFADRGMCADFCFAPARDFGRGLKELGVPQGWMTPCFIGIGYPKEDEAIPEQYSTSPEGHIHLGGW